MLRQTLAEHPDEIYRALLTVILRLVFVLYAEERDMLPENDTFLRHYSLAGLYERLREDAALFPDTMDQRYGAWAQLLVLFRMIHDGAESGAMRLPKRHGVLFDPDRFMFLEGRSSGGARQIHERIEPPLVPAPSLAAVAADMNASIERALEQLRTTTRDDLLTARTVGRAGLPTTTLGLLFHAAEHSTRHAGQAISTAKILAGS